MDDSSPMEHRRKWIFWGLSGALIVSGLLKLWLTFSGSVPFNSDEAIVALMARHILGGARPIFFYGQAYMGSLDAFLVAGIFRLVGEQVWGIRLVQGLLYLLTLVTTAWLGRVALGSWAVGVLAAWILAIPTVNVSLYTTASLGNYGEALVLGNLILISGLRIGRLIREGVSVPGWRWWVWGFMVGIGMWAFGLTLVYSLPVGVGILWQMTKQTSGLRSTICAQWIGLLYLGVGIIMGAIPWIFYAKEYGLRQLVVELGGGAIVGVEGVGGLHQVFAHLVNLVVLGGTAILGLRPPWEVRWLAWPLLPFALIFWLGVLTYIVWRLRKKTGGRFSTLILVGVIFSLGAGFVFSPFGADPSGRYFLPISIVLALFGAEMLMTLRIRYGNWVLSAVLIVLGFNLWGTIQSALRQPPGLTTQFDSIAQVDHRDMPALIEFLHSRGEVNGFSNYWVAYPLAFLSHESLIFTPRLPYHQDFRYTERDDRYAPYGFSIEKADRLAYITTHHPDLDTHLRREFNNIGVSWEEVLIGDYHVFYGLSQRVLPTEIGLGGTYP